MTAISVTVNGRPHTAQVEPRRLLVDFLREDLGLVGTHIGCEHGVCGTCTVLLDGRSIRSCITLAVQADGAEISTVEGLADGAETLYCGTFSTVMFPGLRIGYLIVPQPLVAVFERATRPDPETSPA